MALGPGSFKISLVLLTEVIALYMQVTIIQIGILELEKPI